MPENSNLLDAFIKARQSGVLDEKIKKDALEAGWSNAEIDRTFELLAQNQTQASQPASSTEMNSAVIPQSPISSQVLPQQSAKIQNPQPLQTYAAQTSTSKSKKGGIVLVIIALVLLASGVTAYAFYADINPFSKAPYKEDNLMSGLLERISQIDSASYTARLDLYAVDREEDAAPFETQKRDAAELKAKYGRDSDRFELVTDAISSWQYQYGEIAASVQELFNSTELSPDEEIVKSSITFQPRTDSASGFTMAVTFETSEAITEIKESEKNRQIYDNDSYDPIAINGRTVTFTENSYPYFYFPSTPPLTFFEELAQYSAYLPPELNISAALDIAMGKNENGENTDWTVNVSSDADLGDMTYKVNIDALKKAADYYVRINNLPSLFTSFLPPKGQWIRINSEETEASSDMGMSILPTSEDFNEFEEEYKKNKAEMVEFIKSATRIADEERLFTFKNNPEKETLNGKIVYRYDLQTKKNAVLSFYTRIVEEGKKYDSLKEAEFVTESEEYIAYFKSEEYSEMFDYYDQNVNLTLWVDQDGFPVSVKNSVRIVPPDEIVTLKEKQVLLETTLDIGNINEPTAIEAPENSKPYSEFMEEMMKQFEAEYSGY